VVCLSGGDPWSNRAPAPWILLSRPAAGTYTLDSRCDGARSGQLATCSRAHAGAIGEQVGDIRLWHALCRRAEAVPGVSRLDDMHVAPQHGLCAETSSLPSLYSRPHDRVR
jgi:hypothetical protein